MSKSLTKKQKAAKALKTRKAKSVIFGGIGFLSFLARVTSKGRAAGQYQGTIGQKLKTLVNNFGGNIFGINPIDDGVTPKFTAQRNTNLNAYWNNETKLGLWGIGYSIVGSLARKIPYAGKYIKLPMRSEIGQAGAVAFGAALLGTFFDDVPNTNNPNPGQAWRPQYQMQSQTSRTSVLNTGSMI